MCDKEEARSFRSIAKKLGNKLVKQPVW